MIRQLVYITVILLPLCAGQLENIFVSSTANCSILPHEEYSCETCVRKGHECFWCGGKIKRCMNYEWYFPNCPLDDVRHKNCWVNLSAVVIVVSILGGIVLVILLACLCYCCCRCRQYRQKQASKTEAKRQKKHDKTMTDLEARRADRAEKRDKELEAFRLKYGIHSDTTTSVKK